LYCIDYSPLCLSIVLQRIAHYALYKSSYLHCVYVCVCVCVCVVRLAHMWVAPEVLRLSERRANDYSSYGSQEADVYSFAVIMQEIATCDEPYYAYDLELQGLTFSCLTEQQQSQARRYENVEQVE